MRKQTWNAIQLGQLCPDLSYEDFCAIIYIDRARKKHQRLCKAYANGALEEIDYTHQVRSIEERIIEHVGAAGTERYNGEDIHAGTRVGVVFQHDPSGWTVKTYIRRPCGDWILVEYDM